MQEQTGRMARLIDDLLSLSRLEMKPFLPIGVEVDLRETIDSVIDSLGPLAREAGVEIVQRISDGPVIVAGSRDELFQVFENLLENACKYGQSGGKVVVSIAPRRASGEGETSVTFRDFGPGIAAEHIPRITERFYRVDVDASRGRKGTGLGLSIVKHILTRHNAPAVDQVRGRRGLGLYGASPGARQETLRVSVDDRPRGFLFFVIRRVASGSAAICRCPIRETTPTDADPAHRRAYDDELKFLANASRPWAAMPSAWSTRRSSRWSIPIRASPQKVIADDAVLDDGQREIDDKAILIIAKRQPMADDLREIIGAIRISADLERVGDLGKNVAKRVVAVAEGRQPPSLFRGLQALAELALTQLKEVLDVYASRSVDRIGFMRDRDDQIDAMYTSLFRELLTYMMEDPRNITPCTHLLFCAKNIERIGDHATNIAETIYYIVTGEQMPPERPKEDKSHA